MSTMANNPINLGLRFFLELFMLFSLGYWGWTQHAGLARFLWGIGLPLAAAVLWGVFRVPGDGGPPVVAVAGLLRLALEAVLFGGAVWALYAAQRPTWGLVFGIVLVAHYAISYDRILGMLTT